MPEFAKRMSIVKPSPVRVLTRIMLGDPEMISFAGGNPAVEGYPLEDIARLSEQVLQEKGVKIAQYGSTDGFQEFRESALEYLIKPRGVEAPVENTLTLTGSSQGFDLMARVLLDPGDTVLCDGATFVGALQAYHMAEANVVGVEMDDDGVILEDLEEKMVRYRPKFFYTIPTFQNPTGKTIPAARRQRIAELAAKYDVFVLEDDPYCDLRFRGEPVPPIKTFDQADKVILFNSFSKILIPGLRLGIAVGPEELIRRMSVAKQAAVAFSNTLGEAIADAYLREGLLPAQIAKISPIYGQRCDRLAAGVDRFFPEGTKYVMPDGGMFLWAELPGDPEHYNMTELRMQALKEIKVGFIDGNEMSAIPGKYRNCIRLNFSREPFERIDQGLEKLGAFLKAHTGSPR